MRHKQAASSHQLTPKDRGVRLPTESSHVFARKLTGQCASSDANYVGESSVVQEPCDERDREVCAAGRTYA